MYSPPQKDLNLKWECIYFLSREAYVLLYIFTTNPKLNCYYIVSVLTVHPKVISCCKKKLPVIIQMYCLTHAHVPPRTLPASAWCPLSVL